MPSLPVIVNSRSGPGRTARDLAQLKDHFRAAGAQPEIELARSGAEIVELATKASKQAPARIVAGGGDGTMNAVASVLAGTGIALGVLPLGTLNHFAKDLGIPLDPARAARVAVQGKIASIDVGEVNGRIFLNNSSIGLYPAMVLQREKQRRRLGRSKWHAMFWAALNVLRAHPTLNLRLKLDGIEHHRRTPFVFIGNNVYIMEGFNIGARERLDAGVLSYYLTQRGGRGRFVMLALRALLGRLHQGSDFEAGTTRELRIDSRHRRLLVATDGEIEVLELPLDYRIRPGALRVVRP
jgi:diacylglycerol kinase family enzyme